MPAAELRRQVRDPTPSGLDVGTLSRTVRDRVCVSGVEGGSADRRPVDDRAGIGHVGPTDNGHREAIHAPWRRACTFLTQDRVLAAVAQAFEPVALVA